MNYKYFLMLLEILICFVSIGRGIWPRPTRCYRDSSLEPPRRQHRLWSYDFNNETCKEYVHSFNGTIMDLVAEVNLQGLNAFEKREDCRTTCLNATPPSNASRPKRCFKRYDGEYGKPEMYHPMSVYENGKCEIRKVALILNMTLKQQARFLEDNDYNAFEHHYQCQSWCEISEAEESSNPTSTPSISKT